MAGDIIRCVRFDSCYALQGVHALTYDIATYVDSNFLLTPSEYFIPLEISNKHEPLTPSIMQVLCTSFTFHPLVDQNCLSALTNSSCESCIFLQINK